MIAQNPFTPAFGEIPAYLAGREEILSYVRRALAGTNRDPYLTTIFRGARGTGKTALMSLLADEAAQMGWIVASTSASPNMLEDLEVRVRKNASHLITNAKKSTTHISSIGVPQVIKLDLESNKTAPLQNWRSRIEDILITLEEYGSGVLFTIDEVEADIEELVEFAQVYQHFIREHRRVACLMAGLSSKIDDMEDNQSISFIRRAMQANLGRVDDRDVATAMTRTIEDAGRTISSDARKAAVKATRGFPFLIQMVGYRAWDGSKDKKEISLNDVKWAAANAKDDMYAHVIGPTFRELSDADVDFLMVMDKLARAVADAGASKEPSIKIADIQTELGWAPSQVSQYRRRLIQKGVIRAQKRGVVAFEMPFIQEYIQDEVV